MGRHELFLFIFLTSYNNAKLFHYGGHRIMTPNDAQTGNQLSQVIDAVMFPQLPSNSLAPETNEVSTMSPYMTPIQTTPAVTIPTNSMIFPDLISQSVTPPATTVETVTSIGGTIIKVEFPSSINIFVNITNCGQPVNPSVDISDKSTVEVPTVESPIGTSTVNNNATEVSTFPDIPTDLITTEISSTEASLDVTTLENTDVNTIGDILMTNITENSTVEMSTPETTTPVTLAINSTDVIPTITGTIETPTTDILVTNITETSTAEMSTPDTTTPVTITINTTYVIPTMTGSIETPTTDILVTNITETSTVEMSTPETTTPVTVIRNITDVIPTMSSIETPTTESMVEISTIENTVEISTTETFVEIILDNATTVENISISAPNVYIPTNEGLTHIQINIDLSDNTQNPNFGSTIRPTTEAITPLQNKMIYKEKCDEYYAKSRAERETKVHVLIVGGTSSMPKEFPHMAALGYGNEPKKEWLCGGSLISENYVITAGHCLSSKTLGEVQVARLGTTILTETLNSQDFRIIRRISHPDYNTNEQYNDIALLQLDRPVTFSEYIAPICLYSTGVTQEVLIATGWGKTEPTGEVSQELQKVELEYFPNKECQDSYSSVSKEDLPKGIEDETQICAGSRTDQKDTCQGDSGGPLQIKDDERLYLVGITSFGIACGKPGRPGVYTKVAHYIPWIESIVWSNGR